VLIGLVPPTLDRANERGLALRTNLRYKILTHFLIPSLSIAHIFDVYVIDNIVYTSHSKSSILPGKGEW
jgi:hypothetical protein